MNISRLRKKLMKGYRYGLTGIFALLGSSSLFAQLSGNYTIDQSSPSSSTNYVSFQSFADDLANAGISGPVNVTVLNGPYNEQVSFKEFAGGSSTDYVTIDGNGQQIYYSATSSSSKHTIMLDEADYIHFENLIVEARGAMYAYGIFLKGQCEYNVIKKCEIKVPNVDNNAYYYFSQSYNDGAANIMIAAASNSCPLYFYYSYNAFGQNGRNNIIEGNTLTGGENGATGPMYGIYEAGEVNYPATYQTNNIIKGNDISNFFLAGIVSYFGDGTQILNNNIYRTEDVNGQFYQALYGIFSIYANSQDQEYLVKGNNIHHLDGADAPEDYTYPAYVYGIYFEEVYSSNYRPSYQDNYIHHNKAGSEFYGMFAYGLHDGDVVNNIFSTNIGYYGMYDLQFYYPDNANLLHNTIYTEDVKNYSPYFYYGIYAYHYTNSNSKIVGNNVSSLLNGSGMYAMFLGESETYWTEVDHNNFYANGYTNPIDLNGSQMNVNSFNVQSGWKGNKEVDAKFADAAADDFRTLSFKLNNKVPNVWTTDFTGATRNPVKSDIGAVEVYTDLATDAFDAGSLTTVCGGYSVKPTVTFTNNFADDAEDVTVSVKVGTGAVYTETIKGPIGSGKQYTHTFDNAVEFHNPGNNLVWGGVNIPDDNTANDTLFTIINVKPSPDGGFYTESSKPTKAIYQLSRPFDVTIVNEPVIYTMNAPTTFANSGYNTAWSATSWATTAGGVLRPNSEITMTNPSGSNDYEVQWKTNDLSIEDTMIWLYTRVSDLVNGCDTTIRRQILLFPKIRPSFTIDNLICDGEEIFFDNTSYLRSGGAEYKWFFDFGKTNDSSDATSPVYTYPGPGTYVVKVIGQTIPYGFESELLDTITINPIPQIGFTRLNACEGQAVTLTNTTTPATPTTYVWNFGDGSPNVTTRNASKVYAAAGQYKVTLTANLNGCISTKIATVYQFATPNADFQVLSGSCSNEPISFKNLSTIGSGNVGNYWDFDDNNTVSTKANPTHLFSEGGIKNVLLRTTSEFGCKDSVIKSVVVKQAPLVNFTNTPTCSNTPTQFTNLTDMRGEAVGTINWNFGDGGASTANNPTHAWTTLGPKKITLRVAATNGCFAETHRDVNVGVQPIADFSVENICTGNYAEFINKSSSTQGQMQFRWTFGDTTSASTESNPRVRYIVSATTTYNVTLTAKVEGGCEDIVTKQITINEAAKTCDFDWEVRYDKGYYGVVFKPKTVAGLYTTQQDVKYTWLYAGEGQQVIQGDGTSNEAKFGFHDFQTEGPYQVTMRAKVNNNDCECQSTKWVNIPRASAKDLADQTVSIYPNPNNGQFIIALEPAFGKQVTIVITNSAGAIVKTISAENTGNTPVNVEGLSQGFYNVRVVGANQSASAKLIIQ